MSSSPTSSSNNGANDGSYDGLLDVPCQIDVIVGRGSITVRECLKLQRDSVIRLNEQAGEDLRVEVQGVAAATGEIVVDDETTTVRITEILPPKGDESNQ